MTDTLNQSRSLLGFELGNLTRWDELEYGVPLSGIMGPGEVVYGLLPMGEQLVYYVWVGLYYRRDKDGISCAYSHLHLHLTEFSFLLNCLSDLASCLQSRLYSSAS